MISSWGLTEWFGVCFVLATVAALLAGWLRSELARSEIREFDGEVEGS